MPTLTSKQFQQKILSWFAKNGRKDLPWQKDTTPYRTWISEIMLQQTQVKTVIPYFERFMKQFPSIKKLAEAKLDDVLHLWTGLGYYARARNLHRAAQKIVKEHHGHFPTDLDTIQSLPGIGRSTAGAIAAFSLNQSAPILDGNVKRVLIRYHAIKTLPTEAQTLAQLWKLAENYTPAKNISSYTQAMMDLGALICTRNNPNCTACPLEPSCLAHQQRCENTLPMRQKKKKLPLRKTIFLLLKNKENEILLEKQPPVGIWGGLWCPPQCDEQTDIEKYCTKQWGYSVNSLTKLKSFRHTFSHFHLEITPISIEIAPDTQQIMESTETIWYNQKKQKQIGLPQPVKKLLQQLNDHEEI